MLVACISFGAIAGLLLGIIALGLIASVANKVHKGIAVAHGETALCTGLFSFACGAFWAPRLLLEQETVAACASVYWPTALVVLLILVFYPILRLIRFTASKIGVPE